MSHLATQHANPFKKNVFPYVFPLIMSLVNCLLVFSIALFMYVICINKCQHLFYIYIYYAQVHFTNTRLYISTIKTYIHMYVDTCLLANPPHCSNRICAKRVYLNMYISTSYGRGEKYLSSCLLYPVISGKDTHASSTGIHLFY